MIGSLIIIVTIFILLLALVINNVDDVREVIKMYDGKSNIGKAYNEEIEEKRMKELADRDKGIGGALRSLRRTPQAQTNNALMSLPPLGMPPMDAMPGAPGQELPAPVPDVTLTLPEGKRKTIWHRFRERVKVNEVEAKAKFEEWNAYMMQQQEEYSRKMRQSGGGY